jgi:hypothetical protein
MPEDDVHVPGQDGAVVIACVWLSSGQLVSYEANGQWCGGMKPANCNWPPQSGQVGQCRTGNGLAAIAAYLNPALHLTGPALLDSRGMSSKAQRMFGR